MSADWRRVAVGDLIAEDALAIGDGYRAKNDELSPTGLPFARAGNVNDGFRFDDADRFPQEHLGRVGDKVSRPGDVVFTSKGTVGRFALVRDDTESFVYSPQLCFWRSLDKTRIEPRFLYYWVQGREFFLQYTGVKGQTDMADYVSLSDQRRMHITLPPLAEQQAIAETLGALDDKIELNRRMVRTLHETAWTVFAARYLHCPEREGWPLEPLGEHVEAMRGLSYTGAGLSDGEGLPLHNLDSVYEDGRYKRTGIKWYVGDYKERHLVQPGDVVLANTDLTWNYRVVASPALVPKRFGERGLFSHHLYRLRPKSGSPLTSRLLYLLLLRGALRTEVAGYANGTTVNMLPRDALERPRFRVPPGEVVREVETLTAPLHERAEAAEDESETLAALRDALLPKLISGEIRVATA